MLDAKKDDFDAAKAARWKRASEEIEGRLAELKAETGQHASPVLLRHLREQDDFNRIKEAAE